MPAQLGSPRHALIMEGYLLYLDTQDTSIGELVYGALEEGFLKLYASADRATDALRYEIPLTDHQLRVKLVPYGENGSFVPCRFQVDLEPYQATSGMIRTYLFAAATFQATQAWCDALFDWKRHVFDPSLRSLDIAGNTEACSVVTVAATERTTLEARIVECSLAPHHVVSSSSPTGLAAWFKRHFGT
ncbi:hypothetical protein SPRG_00738 [Saprolegnia parasitica CBS 223.65]|uniref:PH domain-containing protein n=1 Tax=Saprolegnia parasitica (strain CBS 223.65) TaxID=695850 RepID=A0A067CZL8_SAPPC|nr:hypothetical protein SPRG_00738 [Saprolegnia parasitica CBS 223.65]KDO34675.1 hypothetical protein SPRG_00738 [Saprolegnia parasitica CBS 223.65]|eukprot:XP_012194348.1 hypothetical protein SPRG_00738 [Saprolegnia parasitica CBS 223.65]